MTAREELAQSIAANLDRLFGVRDFGPATQDFKLADALLAEGWGKRADIPSDDPAPRASYPADDYECCASGSCEVCNPGAHRWNS